MKVSFRVQITEYRLLSKYLVIFSVLCFLFSVLYGCQSPHLYKDIQVMMGTFVEVVSPYKEAPSIVFDEIKRVENLLSKYKEDSDVAKLNKLGELKVSPDTFYVLQKAKEFWQASDGEFDITVGPLMDLWGFTDKKYRLPKKEEIEKTLKVVGFDKIIFNLVVQESIKHFPIPLRKSLKAIADHAYGGSRQRREGDFLDDNVVKFKLSGMKIDLGGIAKGYAVDCAVKRLKEHGIKSCLINAGGQIYCLGDKFGKPWNIAVRGPRNKGFWGYLKLKDKAVATSGDYEQYFLKGNKRYSHILNPKTGYPANSGVISVTVIAPNGLTADALTTSIFVLGKDKGSTLAKKFTDVKVEIIEEKDVPDPS